MGSNYPTQKQRDRRPTDECIALLDNAKSDSRFIELEAQYYIKKSTRFAVIYHGEELAAITERMKEVNSHNQSAFIRKVAIDGFATNVDLAPVKELISLQRRCVNNLSQIAKHAQIHNAYHAEIMELQNGYSGLWEQYSELLKHLGNSSRCKRMRDFGPTWPEVK